MPAYLRRAHPLPHADLFGDAEASPEGLRYQPGIVTPEEEADLARRLDDLPFAPFDFHGHLANRQIVGFGLRYDYARRAVVEAEPLPAWLTPLRDRVGAFAGQPAAAFVQVLINRYDPGAGIGWHRDKPQFDKVVGVSLLSACPMRFRRPRGAGWERITVPLQPRSAYLLDGPARREWEHSIAPVAQLRYSVTFRSLSRNVSAVPS